jgi:hypothetical protein
MARKPVNFVTVKDGAVITFGGRVMERANYPKFLFAEWTADQVILRREEDYETRKQGIYKVGLGGSGVGQARISAKPIVEGAGLADGRYIPIHVDEDTIILSTTPSQTPDQYARNKDAQEDTAE